MTLGYLYSKFFKIVLRGKSVLNSQIDKTAKIYSGTEFYDSSIGRHSYVGYDSEVHSCDIGSFCSIANGFVVGGAKHPLDWVSTSPIFYNVRGGSGSHLGNLEIVPLKRSTIGHDVWIGNRVTVMQGVNVGIGAVIGAGSVVTKDIPPYAVVAGCPGKVIKYRFDEETIECLLKSEWWSLDDEKLVEMFQYINNPHEFLTKVEMIRIYGGKKSQTNR